MPQSRGSSFISPTPYDSADTRRRFQRSQYLSDAIDQLNASVPGNATRTATGTNASLLANALLQFTRGKADQDIQQGQSSDRAGLADIMLAGHQAAAPSPGETQPMAAPAGGGGLSDAVGGGAEPQTFGWQGPQRSGAPPTAQHPQAPQVATSDAPPTDPGDYSNVPRGVVTPQQWARAQALLQSDNPAMFAQGMEMAQGLMGTEQTPVHLPPGYTFNPDGTVRSLTEHYEPIPGASPADNAQQNTVTGHTEHQALPGVQGPGGSFLTPQGYQTPPSVVGEHVLPFGAPTSDQAVGTINNMMQSPQVSQYYNLRTKAAAALSVAPTAGNAATDLQLIETMQEALNGNPALAVREGIITNITESQGWIARNLYGAQNALSQGASGYLAPEQRARMQRVIRVATHERYQAAEQYVSRMRQAMQPLGYPEEVFPQINPPDDAESTQPQAQGPRVPATVDSPEAFTAWARQNNIPSGTVVTMPSGRPGRAP